MNQTQSQPLVVKLLNFVKVEHTVFSVPLIFVGAWLGAGRTMPSFRVLLLVILAGLGARTLGMAANRIIDRKLDALNPRTQGRELVSGKLTVGQSYLVAGAGMAVYLAAAALLGPLCFALSWVPLVPLIGYSYLKRFTPLCHFGIGVVLGLAPLGAFVAAAGHTQFDMATWALGLFAFSWISGFDIIYALQDIDVDRKIGVKSIPSALGWNGASIVAGALHLVALGAAIWALTDVGLNPFGIAGVMALAVVLVVAQLPKVPLPKRFFPLSAIAGVIGAIVPLLGAI